jgi:hypothetical protein
MFSPELSTSSGASESSIDPAVLVPRLLNGESVQGFLTMKFVPQKANIIPFDKQVVNRMKLHDLL